MVNQQHTKHPDKCTKRKAKNCEGDRKIDERDDHRDNIQRDGDLP